MSTFKLDGMIIMNEKPISLAEASIKVDEFAHECQDVPCTNTCMLYTKFTNNSLIELPSL